jgi:hypothetical protein
MENIPKSFPHKNLKKLASQTENYYFGDQTLKFDYAVNVYVFPSLFCKIDFWTFFLSIFQFPKKVLEQKNTQNYIINGPTYLKEKEIPTPIFKKCLF